MTDHTVDCRARLTTTLTTTIYDPSLADLRAFIEATAELPDDAALTIAHEALAIVLTVEVRP